MGHSDTHRSLHRLFNERNFDGMTAHMRQDLVYDDIPRGLTMKSFDDFTGWLGGWTSAFSDARVESATYLEGANFSLARFRGRGHNDGPMGPLPATERDMDTSFWELFEYDDDGMAVSGGLQYDQVTLLSQLGHIQPPG